MFIPSIIDAEDSLLPIAFSGVDLDSSPRIAIVHDWLPLYGGAERVLEQILALFPTADLFSIVDFIPDGERRFLLNKSVKTSFIQKLPLAERLYRLYLPLMPLAIEQFDLSEYRLVLSSSYAVAKGILTGPDQLHLCYCHSPIRYGWDLQGQYLKQMGTKNSFSKLLARLLLHYIRMWDLRTTQGVDHFASNSAFVARRIKKVYGRKAVVIHPPVDTNAFCLGSVRDSYYLTASRLVPYKKIDLIVEAFAGMPDKRLVVIGDGPEFERIKAIATGNVSMVGFQCRDSLVSYMQRARAFVFAAEEDFGIAPVEAQACGTPVIAYGKGGVTETVVAGETGVFFSEQTTQSLQNGVREFEALGAVFHAERCRINAEKFSVERFRNGFASFVRREWDGFARGAIAASHPGEGYR